MTQHRSTRPSPNHRKAALWALALCAMAPTFAAQPLAAQTQDDVLSAEILPGWRDAAGHYMTALHLRLAPGWKTYWRAPGSAGIPPVFDWSGSRNLGQVRLMWPSPTVIRTNGMQSIGYLDDLILPIALTPADPSTPLDVALRIDLGICHDICMPATLTLTAHLSGPGAPDAAITAALAARPRSPSEAGLTAITCDVTPIADGLHLTAHLTLPDQGGSETVVVETADPTVWVAEAASSRAGPRLTAATDLVATSGAPFALDRSGVTVTVLSPGQSVEIKGCPAP